MTNLMCGELRSRRVRRLQPDRKLLIPALTQILEDSKPEAAITAMSEIADIGEQAVPGLVEALLNKQARHWATVVLGEIGPKAASAVPALEKLVADEDPEVRMQALIALGQIGSAAEPAVPAIIAALKDDEPAVRYGAEFALGKLRATEAAGDLEKLTTSTDPTLKLVATWAIARIHPDDATAVRQAMEVIADGIRSDDPQLSRIAAKALAEVDASSQAITPAIRAALDEMDPTVIEHVMEALATVGAKAVPVLTAAMKDAKTRGAAIRAFGAHRSGCYACCCRSGRGAWRQGSADRQRRGADAGSDWARRRQGRAGTYSATCQAGPRRALRVGVGAGAHRSRGQERRARPAETGQRQRGDG